MRHAHRARTGDVSRTDHPVEEAILHRMVQAAAAYLWAISRAEYQTITSSAAGWAERCTEWRQEKRLPRGDHFLDYTRLGIPLTLLILVICAIAAPLAFPF